MRQRTIDRARVVADVMTRSVVTLFEEDDLDQIEEAMERFRFRHVPVVDDRKLVGLIAHSDLRGLSSSPLDPTGPMRDEAVRKRTFVRDVMKTSVRTVRPDTRILDAARLMRDAKIGCLPVVESDGSLVGIVTCTDMLDLMSDWLEQRERELRSSPARRLPIPRPTPRRASHDRGASSR